MHSSREAIFRIFYNIRKNFIYDFKSLKLSNGNRTLGRALNRNVRNRIAISPKLLFQLFGRNFRYRFFTVSLRP